MTQPVIGAGRDRVEGPQKVSGSNLYTADVHIDGMLYAVVTDSATARGRITSIDATLAQGAPGVVAVMTHRNAPRVDESKHTEQDTKLFLLQSDVVEFDRQPIAVVIATTFEAATHGASLVRASYASQPPMLHMENAPAVPVKQIFGEPGSHMRGTPETAFAAAAVRVHNIYTTPTEHHNPMETHATLAQWDGDRLTLHDATQWAFGVQKRLSTVFGMPAERIRVIAPYVGGAFGGKGTPWSHVPLAAMAAKLVKKPVRLVVTRPQMFGWVGHRPQTRQEISLGAERNGKLVSVSHLVQNETSISDEFTEPSSVFSRDLYAVENYAMNQELRRLNISKPTYQRGPGESTGSFAMETAMDELAYELGMDPLELRLRNYAERDPDKGREYSSKMLRQCYEQAAQRFGWTGRNHTPGSNRHGDLLIGTGMATASRSVHRSEAGMRIVMNLDRSIVLKSGTIEQGTGSPTVYAQLAAEILGVPFETVGFEWGSTDLPNAPIAAGSQTSGTIGSVTVKAANALRERLASLNGTVPPEGITIDVTDKPTEEEEKYATQAFGAHFVEVRVDADFGTVHVERVVSAFDGGRILNEKTARSQMLGGIVWGISMALYEHSRYDTRTGRIMNATLERYLIPTNNDIPAPEIILVSNDDTRINPAGVKGIGEIGITGVAAAIGNAVFHATGKRVRDLPIVPERVMA